MASIMSVNESMTNGVRKTDEMMARPTEIFPPFLGSIFRVDSENRTPEAIWRMYEILKIEKFGKK